VNCLRCGSDTVRLLVGAAFLDAPFLQCVALRNCRLQPRRAATRAARQRRTGRWDCGRGATPAPTGCAAPPIAAASRRSGRPSDRCERGQARGLRRPNRKVWDRANRAGARKAAEPRRGREARWAGCYLAAMR
jgi:hypothetical protein